MIRFERRLLINGIKAIINQVPSRPSHPILGTLQFKFSASFAEVTAFDLSQLATAKIEYILPTTEDKAIDFCLGSPTVFLKLIDSIHADFVDLDLDTESSTLHLNADGSRYDFQVLECDDFPDTAMDAKSNPNGFIRVDKKFSDAFRLASKSVSTDVTKQVLTGMNLQLMADGNVRLSGTDGHRLTIVQFKSDVMSAGGDVIFKANEDDWTEDDWNKFGSLTDEDKAAKAKTKVANLTVDLGVFDSIIGQGDSYDIYFGDGIFNVDLFMVNGDERESLPYAYAGRIKDGAYPLVEQIVPTQFKHSLTFSLNSFIESLERLSLLSGTNGIVTIDYAISNEGFITLSTKNDSGNNTEKINAQTSFDVDKDYSIGFNLKYLMDALKAFKVNGTKEILFKLNEPTHALVIEPIGSVGFTQALTLLMPVQIRS